jgi:hypothetical protein
VKRVLLILCIAAPFAMAAEADAGEAALSRPVVQPASRTTLVAAATPRIAAAPQPLTALQFAARHALTYEDARTYVMLERGRLRVRIYPGTRMAVVAGQEYVLKDRIERRGRDVVLSRRIVGFISHQVEAFFRQERVRAAARVSRPKPAPLPPLPRRSVVTRVRKPQVKPSPAKAARPERKVPRGGEARWVPAARERDWKWIVVHHSDDEEGSVAKYDRYHRYTKGWEHGCGYHFVIGNGSQTGDGEIEVGPRWPRQLHGAHAKTPDNRFNDFGIGICLVGDFDQARGRPSEAQMGALIRLTRWLMERYDVPAEDVVGHCDCCSTCCPGRYFPWQEFRRGLD